MTNRKRYKHDFNHWNLFLRQKIFLLSKLIRHQHATNINSRNRKEITNIIIIIIIVIIIFIFHTFFNKCNLTESTKKLNYLKEMNEFCHSNRSSFIIYESFLETQ